MNWLRLKVDVLLGHKVVMAWGPEWLQGWWYDHMCLPAGEWECRDEPDLLPEVRGG